MQLRKTPQLGFPTLGGTEILGVCCERDEKLSVVKVPALELCSCADFSAYCGCDDPVQSGSSLMCVCVRVCVCVCVCAQRRGMAHFSP